MALKEYLEEDIEGLIDQIETLKAELAACQAAPVAAEDVALLREAEQGLREFEPRPWLAARVAGLLARLEAEGSEAPDASQ